MSLRRTSGRSLARLVARLLIVTLVCALVPAPARASVPAIDRALSLPKLPSSADSVPPLLLVAAGTAANVACTVVFVVVDPRWASKYHRARWMDPRICWVPTEAGGRAAVPAGPRYSTAARFEDESANEPNEAWSIVVVFHGGADEALCLTADVSFLAPDKAPTHLLRPGSRFALLEGARVVARGEIVG
jgi:hypothetical protein